MATQTADTSLVSLTAQLPLLLRAIHALGQRRDHIENAEEIAHELSSITAMVASKFTNDRTAEGILEALRLTVGCVSLGLAHTLPHDDDDAALELLIEQGCERVFQQGFRAIKELAQLPDVAIISIYDHSPHEQERRLKATFMRYCEADPNDFWMGYKNFQREWQSRTKIQSTLNCALWLRKHHSEGPVRGSDMDAEGVLAIALIFALRGNGRIVAKAGQRELEALLATLRKEKPEAEAAWELFLSKLPIEHQTVLRERLSHLRDSHIVTELQRLTKKARPSKSDISNLFQELQNHGGNEIEVDYE
ncbi:MAG: hypothetical protein PHI29_07120 [Gallionella sp.]|nr:hypothetical protein [Gallionella sp.]